MDEQAKGEGNEPISQWDRFWWYAIGGLLGAPVAVVFAEMTGTGWTGLYVFWAAWVPFLWVLTKLGLWRLLGRAFATVFRPLGIVFNPAIKGLEAVIAFFVAVFSGLFTALGAILVLAIIVFVFAGVIGLLWFGIRQLL